MDDGGSRRVLDRCAYLASIVMSNNLVQRLHDEARHVMDTPEAERTMVEAAYHIEALEAENQKLKDELRVFQRANEALDALYKPLPRQGVEVVTVPKQGSQDDRDC